MRKLTVFLVCLSVCLTGFTRKELVEKAKVSRIAYYQCLKEKHDKFQCQTERQRYFDDCILLLEYNPENNPEEEFMERVSREINKTPPDPERINREFYALRKEEDYCEMFPDIKHRLLKDMKDYTFRFKSFAEAGFPELEETKHEDVIPDIKFQRLLKASQEFYIPADPPETSIISPIIHGMTFGIFGEKPDTQTERILSEGLQWMIGLAIPVIIIVILLRKTR